RCSELFLNFSPTFASSGRMSEPELSLQLCYLCWAGSLSAFISKPRDKNPLTVPQVRLSSCYFGYITQRPSSTLAPRLRERTPNSVVGVSSRQNLPYTWKNAKRRKT